MQGASSERQLAWPPKGEIRTSWPFRFENLGVLVVQLLVCIYEYGLYERVYRIRVHVRRGGFPSPIARQPRRCQYRTMRLREALQCRPFWHRHYSNCGDTDHGKSTQRGVINDSVVHGYRYNCINGSLQSTFVHFQLRAAGKRQQPCCANIQ